LSTTIETVSRFGATIARLHAMYSSNLVGYTTAGFGVRSLAAGTTQTVAVAISAGPLDVDRVPVQDPQRAAARMGTTIDTRADPKQSRRPKFGQHPYVEGISTAMVSDLDEAVRRIPLDPATQGTHGAINPCDCRLGELHVPCE
jgi:hypothetical protein